ncbi:16S rRNA (cytidine(1402)-2'-O)-methyltransferase [Patescibacteria group bacterium]
MATLYIIATPIGNLEDMSKRGLRILSEVDLILSEDTRVTKKLLNYYQIKTQTLSYHERSKLKKINYILDLLKQGKNLALVSDAGTPGISDPGNKLISFIAEEKDFTVKTIPIPGPSAVTSAASVSGFAMDRFIFMGFPPTKRKRKKFFEEVVNLKYPVIFYESPYRIIKTLNELQIINQELKIVVCRELTKKFETIYRGRIDKVIEEIKKDKVKGEFVVVLAPK